MGRGTKKKNNRFCLHDDWNFIGFIGAFIRRLRAAGYMSSCRGFKSRRRGLRRRFVRGLVIAAHCIHSYVFRGAWPRSRRIKLNFCRSRRKWLFRRIGIFCAHLSLAVAFNTGNIRRHNFFFNASIYLIVWALGHSFDIGNDAFDFN